MDCFSVWGLSACRAPPNVRKWFEISQTFPSPWQQRAYFIYEFTSSEDVVMMQLIGQFFSIQQFRCGEQMETSNNMNWVWPSDLWVYGSKRIHRLDLTWKVLEPQLSVSCNKGCATARTQLQQFSRVKGRLLHKKQIFRARLMHKATTFIV